MPHGNGTRVDIILTLDADDVIFDEFNLRCDTFF